ncbi:MAG: Nramp family divalent metal transporter [Planctomycetaceae bacterium]|nr:Nramp family divalent metal transporter [Planctomycetaceae bacterium]
MLTEPTPTHNGDEMDHGRLPQWGMADLPQPLPFSLGNIVRTIGPGAILLAGSIGGGEWIVGPMMVVTYGSGILWIATVGILLQMIFNLEAVRYTLYTGEPILTGILRLSPGPKLWARFYIFVAVAQLATPALALGCANVIFAAAMRRMPDSDGADVRAVLWIGYAVLAVIVLLLLSGKSIERLLERLSWFMITVIFGFLVIVNVLFVPLSGWIATFKGFVTPTTLPEGVDLMLLALFATTAGSGGIGNLAISNWVRDKGFGMAAYSGGFGGILATDHVELASAGHVFPATQENLRRWRGWWNYALIDQVALWMVGCVVGMFLNVNLASSIVPVDADVSGYAAGAFQAQYMAEKLWQGFWVLALLNGFWVLFSTQIGNLDGLTRTVADICWAAWPSVHRWPASRLYASLLLAFTVWGVIALAVGENALQLFKILGIVAGPILAVAALQILRVNTRFLPHELRPPLWRRIGLLLCAAFYGTVSLLLLGDLLKGSGIFG